MNNSLNPNLISGLKFAYKNFIESVHDKDLEYIEKNCEKTFVNKISNSINSNQLFISETDTIIINISSVEIEIHFGVRTNRKNNNLNVDSKFVSFMLPNFIRKKSNLTRVYFYNSKNKFTSVAKLDIEFHSNLILKKSPIKEQKFKTHNVIFEIQCNPFYLSKQLFSDNQKEKLEIIISDFDNFMKGNPFI